MAVTLVAASLGACSQPVEPATPREEWEASGIQHYRMTYTSTCGENGWITFDPVTVEVRGEDVAVIAGRAPMVIATVDRLFDAIEALGRDADEASYEFGAYGQPTRIRIDSILNAIDDEFCVTVDDFQPLDR